MRKSRFTGEQIIKVLKEHAAGLSASAPPDFVLIGPVQPCGCNCPLSPDVTVRPVHSLGSAALLGVIICAGAVPENEIRQIRTRAAQN